jgi:hypothetical protein
MEVQDISAMEDGTAELMAAERLLGHRSTGLGVDQPAPELPKGANLTLGIIRAMKELGYGQMLIPDPTSGGGEMYFVQRDRVDVMPPEEEYIRYEHNPASTATATCKAALIGLNRSVAPSLQGSDDPSTDE